MIVTVWNNGSHNASGSGYGLKISIPDRDRYFRREWKTVFLELEGQPGSIEINIDKDSFWNLTCHELISIDIGRWLIKHRLAPWKKGNPPKLYLTPTSPRHFRLTKNE